MIPQVQQEHRFPRPGYVELVTRHPDCFPITFSYFLLTSTRGQWFSWRLRKIQQSATGHVARGRALGG